MEPDPPTWTNEQILAEFGDSVLVARDVRAQPVPLPSALSSLGRDVSGVPWEIQTETIHDQDMPLLARAWWDALEEPGVPLSVTLRRRRSGGWRQESLTVLDLRHQPELSCVLIAMRDEGSCADPTDGRPLHPVDSAEDAIAHFERPVWLLQELDPLGRVLNTEGDTEAIFGRGPGDLQGQSVLGYLHPEDHAPAIEMWTSLLSDPGSSRTIRQRVLHPDGSHRWIESTIMNRLQHDDGGVLLSISHDITERRREERVLRRRAFTDPLTGLPNRLAVDAALTRMLAAGPATVAFIDLDGFKAVNDDLGHRLGDRVLEAVAKRLSNGLADVATVGRWGGDEFVAVGTGDCEEEIRSAIDAAFADPVVLEDETWHPRCSYGIAHGDTSSDPTQLVISADNAMYEAKERRAG